MRKSIRERGHISKGLMRAMGIVFNEPVGEVEVAFVDFVEADLRHGDMVEIRTKLEKRTRSVIFVSATFTVGDETVMEPSLPPKQLTGVLVTTASSSAGSVIAMDGTSVITHAALAASLIMTS